MDKFPRIEDMAKYVAQRALQLITINNMPLTEFVEKLNNAIENNNCNLINCRHNEDGKCTNDEKREECVIFSKAVLMIDDLADIEMPDNQWVKNKNPFNACDTNPNCECDPSTCGFAVEYSTLEDVDNGIHKYMCGRDKCRYCE